MDDLPEKLRALYVAYGTDYVQAAANEIESLRQRLAAAGICNDMLMGRSMKVEVQLAECERERDELKKRFEGLIRKPPPSRFG